MTSSVYSCLLLYTVRLSLLRHHPNNIKVTAVTVGVKNGRLIKILGQRKAVIRSLNMIGWDNPKDDDYIDEKAREQVKIVNDEFPPPPPNTS